MTASSPGSHSSSLTKRVLRYWEAEPCGTGAPELASLEEGSLAWFLELERTRYLLDPYIWSVAQFSRHAGQRVLEVGVGAGTDHAQWAAVTDDLCGVDLTLAAIETTTRNLALRGLQSNLQQLDAEVLPFESASFDVVYSWGVIHHADAPERIIAEIQRVLRVGGVFLGMLYARHSMVAYRKWVGNALKAGRPWRSLSSMIWDHMESVGTKAYTETEVRRLFAEFDCCLTQRFLTPYDTEGLPAPFARLLPAAAGWNIAIDATR
ncbi:MAG: class I SAM-dependent methyltransferase [Actinomycetota bacterium]|nr:class I SAM-dependent methyltransferase [Actinomycetota bacterium]